MSTTATEKPATDAKVTPIKTRQSAATRKAAAGAKVTPAKVTPKPAGKKTAAKKDTPSKTQVRHAICARVMVALEADSKKISDAQLRQLGFDRKTYVETVAELCDYLPILPADWNVAYFGHKMGRGGRPTTKSA